MPLIVKHSQKHPPEQALPTSCRYDPVSDRWTTVKPMGSPRFALAAAVLKGSMVCAGGFDGQRHLASAELYDPRAGRWNSWPRRLVHEAIMQQACISHACLLTKAAKSDSLL